MMKILFIPVRRDKNITYEYLGEKIRATFEGQTDEFDFSTFAEDGILQDIETTLPFNPIFEAKRENGILYLKLIYYHGANATQEELFPDWIEV